MPDRLTRTLDQAILELQELQELLEVLETRTQTTLRVVEATAAAEATLALPIVPIADETRCAIYQEVERKKKGTSRLQNSAKVRRSPSMAE